ncbi:MAG: hypothetical protein ACW99A_03475 [Candidatus Kariarchaeaceae archaeon]
MTEECKELEKKAKELEKNDTLEAVSLYKLASECFAKHDKIKNKNANLVKAAKLLRELGKSNEDPTIALDYYEESSSIYTQIEKEVEAHKVIKEAYQKFVESAKLLILEARKMDDIDAAEKKLKLASQYATLGEDEELSNRSWVESGDQFYKAAKVIEEPREAFEIFKHSIINYNKGKATEKQNLLLTDAAEKFLKKGSEIYKTNKTLVLALDNYIQATTLYQTAKSEQKSKDVDRRIQEICDKIGIPKDRIINYLDLQGIKAVSFDEVIQIAAPIDKQIMDVDKSDIGITEKEKEVEPRIVTPIPEVMDEIKTPTPEPVVSEDKPDIERERTPKPKMEEIETPKVEEPVIASPPEVMEEIETSVSSDIVQPEIHDTTPDPQMEEIETPKIEEPVITSPPEVKEEIAEVIISDVVDQEIHESTAEPVIPIVKPESKTETIPEPQMEEEKIPKVVEPIITSPSKVTEEIEEKKNIVISGLKPMTPLKQEEKSDLRQSLASSTSGFQDHQKKSFTPDTTKDQIPEESAFIPKAGDLRTLSEPIIEILRKQGYINQNMSANGELLQVSEYQILLFLVNNHPVPLEEIEEKTDVSSVSLALSNLQADGLIEQTNDYQWTISQKVKNTIT